MNSLTTTQSLAVGSLLGGAAAFVSIFYILLIIAWWKLFIKAGEKGWKSIIPIYNIYIYCRIIGINFWIYVVAIPIALSILQTIATGNNFNAENPSGFAVFANLLLGAYTIFLAIYEAIKLGDAFKKGTGFKVGTVCFPHIFLFILAFGSAKYHGAKAKK